MTVSSIPRTVRYTADGSSDTFAVPFQFFEINVYVNGELLSPLLYTINQTLPGTFGSVTFIDAPAAASVVDIAGDTEIVQVTDYVEQDSFPAESHERALDRLTMAVQELDERVTGDVDAPPMSPDFSLTAATNANVVTIVDGKPYQTPLANVLSINNVSPIGRTLNVGDVVPHVFEEVPAGWIRLKSTPQPVLKSLYPEYTAKCAAEGFPYGHTTTHVNVPAISAFIRAWDDSGPGDSNPSDPDSATRIANGSGTAVGNLIGSRQLSQNKSHNHTKGTLGGTADSAGKHRHGYVNRDAIGRDAGSGGVSLARGAGVSDNTTESGEHSHSLTITGSTADSGGSEARPDNVAFPYIMLLSPGDAAAPHSVLGLPYNFDDGTSDADPGDGNFRFNHATLASATEVYISNEQAFGADVTGYLEEYNKNNAPTRGYLLVYAIANLGICAIAKVGGSVTVGSDYTKIPIEVLSSNGEFDDGMRLSVQALPAGQISVALDAAVSAAEAAQAAAEIAKVDAENAATAADNAKDDAETAATTATNAKNDAENARNDAVSAWDAFDDVYLGAHASDPTLDNDGDPLVVGQLYWSTADSALKIYDGAAWGSYNPASGGGAVADNVAGVKATPVSVKSVILREAGRAGTFVWRTGDYSALVTADTAGGIYLASDYVASTSGAWVRVYDGPVLVTWFGVSSASADNTSAYDAIISAVPSGASLLFPPSQTLLGHFVSSKSFRIDLNGSTLVNVSDTTAILQLGAVTPTAHNVTETTLAHGDRSFTVTGASGLFAAGEIGYLWDSAVRPSDSQPVNYECVRIAGVSGDVVTVEGFLRSHKGAGAIKFYHSPDQIKNAAIINGFAAPTSNHTWPVFSIWNCYDATVRDLDVTGGRGNAVSLRNSYDVEIENTALRNPSGTGSGEGYGTAVLTCTAVRGRNICGIGARHVYDQDSVYDFDIDGVTDWSPASAACVIAHNGFAAYGTVRNVRTRVADYAITYSAQGFGTGGGNALRQNHPAREVYIKNVHHTVPSTMHANTSFISIYIQTDVSGGVSDCTLRFENSTAVSNTSPSRLLRVTGAMVGEYHVENLDANRVGSIMFADNYANGPAGVGACYIRNLRCPETRIPVWLRGDWGVDVDGLWLGTVAGDQLVLMETLNSDAPLFAAVGASIRYSGTDREIIRTSQATTGTKAPIARLSGSSVSVVAGAAISLVDVQNRDAMFTLVTPTGAGTCTLSATDALPAPQINGAELYIRTVSGRNDASFPAGNNINGAFVIPAGGAARVVSYAGKWVATVY